MVLRLIFAYNNSLHYIRKFENLNLPMILSMISYRLTDAFLIVFLNKRQTYIVKLGNHKIILIKYLKLRGKYFKYFKPQIIVSKNSLLDIFES